MKRLSFTPLERYNIASGYVAVRQSFIRFSNSSFNWLQNLILSLFKKFSVRTSETVVTGVDDQFVRSKEGILKILQVLFGAIAWIIMASLPYMRMIYTQGHTAPFHAIMTCKFFSRRKFSKHKINYIKSSLCGHSEEKAEHYAILYNIKFLTLSLNNEER